MEKLILDLQDHLQQTCGSLLGTVDEDYGQLQMMFQEEAASDTYPITSPALLINTQSVSWNNLAKAAQKGTATVVVTLAIDCYDDTHIDQPQRTLIEDRLTLMERIHWALQNFKPSGATPLVRTQTRLYHLPHLWKAYETTYLCEVTDTQPPNQSTKNTP